MSTLLSPLDLIIFVGSLILVMAIGLWAGWREDTSDDYYLAGRSARWWGVAASIFGSNVSANHIVGMMGLGYTVGFAQSHFEISAIAGLLLLCYGFLPMYRKLNVYTLSQYLSERYNDGCRMIYAMIMIVVIVVIQMVPGFYIGSRSLNILLKSGATAAAKASVANGEIVDAEIVDGGQGYVAAPIVQAPAPENNAGRRAELRAEITDGAITSITVVDGGSGYGSEQSLVLSLSGGADFDDELSPGDVNPRWYILGILMMAVVTGAYTILGGLKAVIVTDVIQSVLLLVAGMILALFTFAQPEVGGWAGMVAMDSGVNGADKLHLFRPASDPDLPWTGVLGGLFVLHFYYWGANQFIVQRALAARSDGEARMGIIAAGFFKLLIPFFAIAGGIAAFYMFQKQAKEVDQDAVFITLLTDLVAPVGFGLVGLVAAGLVGAILSSLDSMMNSAATIITFDVYQRYIKPDADEKQLIWVGRLCIVVFIVGSALLTIYTMDPNSTSSFFLQIADHQSKLVAGVVVAFIVGMLWSRATAAGALAAMIAGSAFSYALPHAYEAVFTEESAVVGIFGPKLNFMHSVMIAAILAVIVHIVVSLMTPHNAKKAQLTWHAMGVISLETLRRFFIMLFVSLLLFAVLGAAMVYGYLPPVAAATIAFVWTWAGFIVAASRNAAKSSGGSSPGAVVRNDRFWGGLLAATAMFMMYYFY